MLAVSQKNKGKKLKSIALPAEHGAWSFLLEPILIGLLLAWSWQGALLSLSALGAFLLHQPLKIYLLAWRKKAVHSQRAQLALRFTVAYSGVALLSMLVLLKISSPVFLLPLMLALPLVTVQLIFDARKKSRELLPEICGALALASLAPAIALLSAWTFQAAAVLWLICAARAVTAIYYVRARLRLERQKPCERWPVFLSHSVALLILWPLAINAVLPWLVVLNFVVLGVRAVIGLSSLRKARTAKQLGFAEVFFGCTTIFFVALGHHAAL